MPVSYCNWAPTVARFVFWLLLLRLLLAVAIVASGLLRRDEAGAIEAGAVEARVPALASTAS